MVEGVVRKASLRRWPLSWDLKQVRACAVQILGEECSRQNAAVLAVAPAEARRCVWGTAGVPWLSQEADGISQVRGASSGSALHCKDFGFYSDRDRKPLEHFEYRRDIVLKGLLWLQVWKPGDQRERPTVNQWVSTLARKVVRKGQIPKSFFRESQWNL